MPVAYFNIFQNLKPIWCHFRSKMLVQMNCLLLNEKRYHMDILQIRSMHFGYILTLFYKLCKWCIYWQLFTNNEFIINYIFQLISMLSFEMVFSKSDFMTFSDFFLSILKTQLSFVHIIKIMNSKNYSVPLWSGPCGHCPPMLQSRWVKNKDWIIWVYKNMKKSKHQCCCMPKINYDYSLYKLNRHFCLKWTIMFLVIID